MIINERAVIMWGGWASIPFINMLTITTAQTSTRGTVMVWGLPNIVDMTWIPRGVITTLWASRPLIHGNSHNKHWQLYATHQSLCQFWCFWRNCTLYNLPITQVFLQNCRHGKVVGSSHHISYQGKKNCAINHGNQENQGNKYCAYHRKIRQSFNDLK